MITFLSLAQKASTFLMAQPACMIPHHHHSTDFNPVNWATQVESRLPTTRQRRSLIQAPKAISSSLKSPELKPLNVSPTNSSVPQKTSVLHNKHLLIGQRVWTSDGRAGTLQFKGKTHFSQGCLCGIRLDEPLGKNDGSVDGIQYFECGPNHGIFIHAFKVQAVNSASEFKPLELAPNATGKLSLSPQPKTSKQESVKQSSSKIPDVAVKIARPKSLSVSDKTPIRQPAARRGLVKKTEITRIESLTGEKSSSNSSKLFQKKRISPADSGITIPGWVHERSPPSRLPSIHSRSPAAAAPSSQDATFTVVHDQTFVCRNRSSSDRSPASLRKTPEGSSPRGRAGGLKKALTSRPSLNDLTELFHNEENNESDNSKLRKTKTRQSAERGSGQHKISPIAAENKVNRIPKPKDLNITFEVGKNKALVLWDSADKVTSTPLSGTNNTYFWESEGVSPTDIKKNPEDPDCEFPEGEDIEYNEFWAVPSALDTPTGRLRFDLLTPEEFEQALKDCNIPLESPQHELPPPLEEADIAHKLTDHCKPKILDSLTVVEDDLLVGSDSTLETIPSFLVPAWSMDLDASLEAVQLEEEKPELENSGCLNGDVASDAAPVGERKAQDSTDVANNNTRIIYSPSELERETEIENDRTTLGIESGNGSAPKATDSSDLVDHESAATVAHISEEDQCVFTNNLSDEWRNLVEQAEAGIDPAKSDVDKEMSLFAGTSEAAALRSSGSDTEADVQLGIPDACIHHVTTVTGETNATDTLKAVHPSVTLNILNTTYNYVEKEKSFVSEGSSESANTVIVGTATEQAGMKERSPSAELETITQCEMAEMTSPSYDKTKFTSDALKSAPANKTTQIVTLRAKENGDQSKLPKKRISYLQQPKSFSSNKDADAATAKGNIVAATKLKLTAAKSLDTKLDTTKRGYQPAPWKAAANGRNPAAATTNRSNNNSSSRGVAPRPKPSESIPKDTKASIKLISVKSKIDTGRKSLDLAASNKPNFTLPPHKKLSAQNSTSSLEVEPTSLSSSNRSMKSDFSGVVTRTSSRSSSIGGKPANKTTSTLARQNDRKKSTSSETSQRTESRTSLSSRLSASTSDEEPAPTARAQGFTFSKPSRPAPVCKVAASKNSAGNQAKSEVKQCNSLITNGATAVDAAPVRRSATTRLPRTSLLPNKKTDNGHQDVSRRPSTGKEVDANKSSSKARTPASSSLSPTPSLVDPELLAKANAEVKRLVALCEARTKQLNMMRLNLRSGLQGFDAMTILVQYLTGKLDAFANPHLKTRIQEFEKLLEDAKNLAVHKEEELSCLQRELVDTRRSNEEQLDEARQDHLEEVSLLEERLHKQHTQNVATLEASHDQEICLLKEQQLAQVNELTASHDESLRGMEEHHVEEVSAIQQQHQEHVEELNRQHLNEKGQWLEDTKVQHQELQDEIYKWTFQCENQKERILRLEEALQKDSDAKIQVAFLEKRKLEADIDSMKAVEDFRTEELMELRRENMAVKKDLDKIPVKDDEIDRLKAKVEDLQAMMAKKQDYQRQLSSDHITLRENYEREVHEKKRLSMEKEQLSWRLSLHSEGTSPSALSPGSFFSSSSPSRSPTRSPTRSPNPSPTPSPPTVGSKRNLSRTSSIESHESGVFSPQIG